MVAPTVINTARSVAWFQVLDALGISVQSHALPTSVSCPFCAGQMLLFFDHQTPDAWFLCEESRRSGNMIDLAAAVWRTDAGGAIRRLAKAGCPIDASPADIEHYHQTLEIPRRKYRALWEQALGQSFYHNTDAREIAEGLGAPCDFTPEQWLEGPCQILRKSDRRAFHSTFSTKKKLRAGTNARFFGKGWSDILLLPLRDLPGQIASFAVFGGQGRWPEDFRVRRIYRGGAQGRLRESGIAATEDLRYVSANWGKRVVAIHNLALWASLQLRHWRQAKSFLPLAAWWHGRYSAAVIHGCPLHSWQLVFDREMSFWTPDFDPAVVFQAILTGGKISTADLNPQKQDPELFIEQVFATAQPWQEAIVPLLSGAEPAGAEQLLHAFKQYGWTPGDIRGVFPPACRKYLPAEKEGAPKRRFVPVSASVSICEQDDGWYAHLLKRPNYGVLISNGILRIEQFVVYADETYCRGYVLHEDERIPFFAPLKNLEQSAVLFMRELLLQHGSVLKVNANWSNQLMSLAEDFYPAEVVRGPRKVGWDAAQQLFVLPRFSLQPGNSQLLPSQPLLLRPPVPAANLQPPDGPLTAEELNIPAGYRPLFWASIAAVLSQILSRVCNRRSMGIGFSGECAVNVGLALAEDAGCLTFSPWQTNLRSNAPLAEATHDWPIVFRQDWKACQFWANWAVGDGPRNVCTGFSQKSSYFYEMNDWVLLREDHATTTNAALQRVTKKLVPAYLQDLFARRLIMQPAPTWVDTVLRDLKDFAGRCGVNYDAAVEGEKCLSPTRGDPVETFRRVVGRTIMDGWRSVLPTEDPETILLRKWVVRAFSASRHFLPRSREVISKILLDAGLLRSEDKQFWVLPKSWLRDCLEQASTRLEGIGGE